MNEVVIVAACRTAIGKHGGALKSMNALDITIPVMQALIHRSGLEAGLLDDVIWGCNYQKTYNENNLARVAAVKAGLPVSVPGITLHRNCTSSMSAVQMGYYQIKAGEAEAIMAGGTDSMSNASYTVEKMRWGSRLGHAEVRDSMWDSLTSLGIGPAMGITAENLAEKHGITREEQDELALLSNQRAVRAIDQGLFKEEIIPLEIKERKKISIFDMDEHPRRDTTMESLSSLKPAFKENGTVTAGNSSQMSDGAAAVIIMSRAKAQAMELKPLARFVKYAVGGVPPEIMGIGPVVAVPKVLQLAGMTLDEIGLIELNEAFAAQSLAVIRELGLDESITNVNGGAIALGHPLGCTGAKLTTQLIHEMKRRDIQYGLVTMCIGGGMGAACIFENLN